jgi:hypothetical protein
MSGAVPLLPQYAFWRGAHLKHRDNFTFILYTSICDFYMVFNSLYLYDFVTYLCRQQATVVLNHESFNIHNIDQWEAEHRNTKALSFVAVSHNNINQFSRQ